MPPASAIRLPVWEGWGEGGKEEWGAKREGMGGETKEGGWRERKCDPNI